VNRFHVSTRRVAAFVAVVGVALVVLAVPAGAHAVLENASPGPNTTVDRSPRQITLTFSESVDARADDIRLFDRSLNAVDLGDTHHPAGDRTRLVATVPRLGQGLYTVAWRTISADSHPVQGAFTFGVGVTATGKDAVALTAQASAGEQGDTAVGVLLGVMRWGVFAGLAIVIGGAFFVIFLWPSGRTSVQTRRLLLFGIELAFVATVGGLLLQGPYTSGGGLGDVFGSDALSTTLDTRFGRVWVARLVLLVVMALLLRLALRKGPRSRGEVVGVAVVAVLLAGTVAAAGHASAGRWVPVGFGVDLFHVLAMSVWVGGLLALVLARHDDVAYSEVTERFSGVALASVVVIILTGVVQTVRQVQPLSALWDSTYGAVLIAKVAAFVVILGIASWSRRLVHGRLLSFSTVPRLDDVDETVHTTEVDTLTDADGAVSTLVRDETTTTTRVHPRRLTNAVIGEILFAAVVLAFTAILVNTSPPHAAPGPQPVNGTIGTGATRFETYFGPAEAGKPNDLHVTAIGRNGLPRPVVDMEAKIANPGKDVPDIAIPLRPYPGATGHYTASGIQVPPGNWKLTVTAYVTDVDAVTATADVRVG
jgi:copper transport protein